MLGTRYALVRSLRLSRMSNPKDIDGLCRDAIHHDVIGVHHELTRGRDAPRARPMRRRCHTGRARDAWRPPVSSWRTPITSWCIASRQRPSMSFGFDMRLRRSERTRAYLVPNIAMPLMPGQTLSIPYLISYLPQEGR